MPKMRDTEYHYLVPVVKHLRVMSKNIVLQYTIVRYSLVMSPKGIKHFYHLSLQNYQNGPILPISQNDLIYELVNHIKTIVH